MSNIEFMKLNWGYSIILFFIAFFTLMIGFVIFSFRQSTDLVTEDYYEKGAAYTIQMEINSRSAVYKDSIRLTNQGQMVIAGFANSITRMADTMHIYFYRPSDKKSDYRINLLIHNDSVSIEKKALASGRYVVKFQWNSEAKNYEIEKEYFVQ